MDNEGFDLMGLLASMPWLLIPVGTIFLWIGIAYLWDKVIRPARVAKGEPMATFSSLLSRTLRFMFKEDKYPAYRKDEKGEQTSELKYPKIGKFLVWRNVYLLGFGLSFILAVIGNPAAPYILLVTVLLAISRVSRVFAQRHGILIRMFEVAASEMGYPREANLNPWQWVQIAEWDRLTIPGETHVIFPNKWKSEEQRNRENFERHFNGTVTDDNTWLYTWQSSKSMVTCSPVTHIPEFAQYKGSSDSEWNKIPLGLGADGEVYWDVSQSPMSLVTGTTGGGKLLSLSISVETIGGQKTIGDLKVGDTLFDPDGNPTKVTHLHPIVTPAKAYELTFSNGEKIIADPDHLWETETRESRLSRFNSVTKEHKRDRKHWLDDATEAAVRKAYDEATNEDTISIREVSELTGKHSTTQIFHNIAREIGVAEEVVPVITLHHKAQVMIQKQTLTYAPSAHIMERYNSRRITATKRNPLTRNQWDKLRQLRSEVRDTDTLTVESVIEYLGGGKFTADWVRDNFDVTLGAKNAASVLYAKGELVKSNLPDKIFSIDAEHLNARQFASLLGVDFADHIRSLFTSLAIGSETFKRKEAVELIRPERVTKQQGPPYFVYPKKMFLDRLLKYNETPMNDQRHKHLTPEIRTTREIFDTLKTTGMTLYTNHSVSKAKALSVPEAELPIMPYALGAWLGDGSSHNGSVVGIDHQIFQNIKNAGFQPKQETLEKGFDGKHENYRVAVFPTLRQSLRDEGMIVPRGYSIRQNGSPKHIPSVYFTASVEQRRELLRGLLDTDGTVKDNGAVQFITSVAQLKNDVKRLVAGLGYIPFVSEKLPTYTHNGEKKTSQTVSYTITFQADPADRLFGLDRKNEVHAERYNHGDAHSTSELHYIVDVQEVEPEPMRCISVDSPTRLFLVSESNIATHNSTIQRNIIFHCIQHPDRWRFLGIDVKRVELSPFISYDPVVMGIATDVPDGVEIIRYAKEEMENRYKKMEAAGVNHFKDLQEHMYALMIMVDETYMFLAPSGIKTDESKEEDALKGEASKLIGDIARLGRAAGVHLILATQRPDATVIYGELKQNLALRIAAGKADTIASQMTLDNENATRLPGNIKGRGYLQNFGEGEQFQGYFAPTDWIDKYLSGDSEWLAYWAKNARDIDQDGKRKGSEAEIGSASKKSGFMAKMKAKAAGDDFIEGEVVENQPTGDTESTASDKKSKKPKKKGGFLAQIDAINKRAEARYDEADSDGDGVPDKAFVPEHLADDENWDVPGAPSGLDSEDGVPSVNLRKDSGTDPKDAARELKSAASSSFFEDSDGNVFGGGDAFEVKNESNDSPQDDMLIPLEPVDDVFSPSADDSFDFDFDDDSFDFGPLSGSSESGESSDSVGVGIPDLSSVKDDSSDNLFDDDDPFAGLSWGNDETPSAKIQKKPVTAPEPTKKEASAGKAQAEKKASAPVPKAASKPSSAPRTESGVPRPGAAPQRPQRPTALPPRPKRPGA